MPTITAVGVAKPNAHGQAITKTLTAEINAMANAAPDPIVPDAKIIQDANDKTAMTKTDGTKYSEIVSTNF